MENLENLSDLGKELYTLLYKEEGKREKREKDFVHPLERYVFAIDANFDDDSLLRVIGERIGIYIRDDEDAAVTLFLKLKKYLENEKDVERTRELMNMPYNNDPKYANRLFDL